MMVTINSDDPAYFGGYMNANFTAIAKALDLSKRDLGELAKNGFKASWLSEEAQKAHLVEIDRYIEFA